MFLSLLLQLSLGVAGVELRDVVVAKSLMRSMLGGSLEGDEEDENLQVEAQDDPMDVDEAPRPPLPETPQAVQTRRQTAAAQTYAAPSHNIILC